MDFVEQVKSSVDIVKVVGEYVRLRKAGPQRYVGLCPFHNEKTPSFTVNDDKGFYHCFGCGAHGDAIRFLTDQRGMPFMDAVKELAAKAGMEVPAPDPRIRPTFEFSAASFLGGPALSSAHYETAGPSVQHFATPGAMPP